MLSTYSNAVRPQWHSPTRNDSHYSIPCDSSSHGSPRLERGGLGICEGLPIVQRSRMICRDVRVGSQRCGSVYCKSPCIMVEKTSIFLPIVGGERWTGEHSDHRTWRSFVYLFGAFCFKPRSPATRTASPGKCAFPPHSRRS